ncbi:hypothetical protein MJO28_008892 [Puccinia striiformis f. sp. tritici]|uniref:Secreted protein n=3 Tax=Puccinia striiformis TaxID=27350 RepID=A0A0L0VEL9_9BASI|nr:hypothetical protein Pst134EA_015066 [Puccinia striiformis f. sp. tritici]KAI9610291.1 hypothetical protein KEM48_002577 [Puccinia striiformis f. sp. tritici PST-130]KNE97641.1 hypothetical protein PSTG_09047 [Puccinia striiformis f. sp. tritici PST-78]POW02095.1 hypothetical protein PSTT_12038 [Puccinia striiformis]KAH9452232.1 hypothetical protein Pst134EB_016187 [Puccinia striiformis f. sp. tritici]KAH9462977.1 hypothetical protein Pst134EA_015066 [Puccinia striiformis f. sp. tritici]
MPSLSGSFIALALVAQASAHLSLISIYGSNNVVGHGFGVNLHGKYPRQKGIAGDAGGDSTVFETGTDNPTPACGRTPEFGPVDIPAWLSQAEGDGLPAAHANMSVVADAFQVNRDGGGPMSCEFNEDATAASWKPMVMILNQAGNSGIQNEARTNQTVVMSFPQGAKCTGGWSQAACIVRCRTGVNKRFGGCFAVKLSGSTSAAVTLSTSVTSSLLDLASKTNDTNSTPSVGSSTSQLSDEQLSSIADQVVIQMKKQGLIVAASASQTDDASSVTNLNVTELSQLSQAIQLDSNSTSVSENDQSTNNTSTVDASEAEDNHLYNLTNSNVTANVASAIVDNEVYNLPAPKPKPHKSRGKHHRRPHAHKRVPEIEGISGPLTSTESY